MSARESAHAAYSRAFHIIVALIVIAWYGAAYFAARPLTEAPVGDSWVYEHAVTHFNHSGTIQLPGFTQAMPVVQVLYGVAWSRLFAESSRSLDISTAVLGVLGCFFFYGLARKCGADAWASAAATALIACNPCYLFLSFSFMTDVPFLVALFASYLAFAYAISRSWRRYLWLAGAAAAAGFAIRPFAAATLVAEVAALLVSRDNRSEAKGRPKIVAVVPLLAALSACAGFWIWLTILNPKPWMLEYNEHRLWSYFTAVPIRSYLAGGVLEPAIYLGIVLSPLALLHAIQQWRRSIVIAGAILAASITILLLGSEPVWSLERITCFGGSFGALVLSGATPHDLSTNVGWILLILGAVGFAGICIAWCKAIRNTNCAVGAVLLAGTIYWMAIPALWLFADRYYLVLVPAACLPLALVPLVRRPVVTTGAALMTAALAFVSVGGLVSYHRTMQKIVMETAALLRQGIPRRQIDAGYSLNGRDLYVYPVKGIDSPRDEPPIPLIIGSTVSPYVISTSSIPNTAIWQEFSGCGPLGFGRRPLFILRKSMPPPSSKGRLVAPPAIGR